MEIARERFLDDTRQYYMTLSLQSRTTQMHGVLSELTSDQRDEVSLVMSRALDQLTHILQAGLPQ